MALSPTFTVADYLATRLCQLQCHHLFGVAGNYSAPLLDTLLMNKDYGIEYVRVPNELCGGYAADAYARIRGISAIAVTYSVGAFILANPVAGAFVEQIPVVVINGAPTNKEWANTAQTGLAYSHSLNDPLSNLAVFRNITGASERITNASEAPFQIDAVLMACISRSTPVYLEVLEDVWRAPCVPPAGELKAGHTYVTATGDNSSLNRAIKASMELINQYQKPFFWLGAEIQRKGLEGITSDIINNNQIPFTTSVMGKGVLSEASPYFKGVYTPPAGVTDTYFEGPDGKPLGECLIGLGAWNTSKDVAFQNIESHRVILAARTGVRVGAYFFPQVKLGEYIAALDKALQNNKVIPADLLKPMPALRFASEQLTYDLFIELLKPWIQEHPDYRLIADAGFPLISASALPVAKQGHFICQASWLSIGYSMGAAIGAGCADPGSRPVVLVGDGSFQETCQAVSAHSQLGHGTVVFVIVNGIYGIEQELVNPNPFRTGDNKVDYSNPLFNEVFPYNELHSWKYEQICNVMGGIGRSVSKVAELSEVLDEIRKQPQQNFVVAVNVPRDDAPGSLQKSLLSSKPGEDEIVNPNWPPYLVY